MCNIAGYVGTKAAAPILIDLIRRQEGINGGYYTGIATIHEGKLYYAKLTGDVQRLLEETDAANFPGTIGIIHSRTKSGGGDEWAHPFVGKNAEGEAIIAYVANGISGSFEHRKDEYTAIAEEMIANGYPMNARVPGSSSKYQTLSDGTAVHMSDVMCQSIWRNVNRGMTSADAMETSFCEMPVEIVGLLLSLKETDRITYSRINAPMHVAFAEHGAYLSSTPMVFGLDAGEAIALPACSCGNVYKDKVEIKTFKNPPAKVAELTAPVRAKIYETICEELKKAPKRFCELPQIVAPLFGQEAPRPSALAIYEVLYSLQKQGVLKMEEHRVEGVVEGVDVPQVKFYL